MRTFPLIRKKLSNEHIMSGVFIVLVLYHLPVFVNHPIEIARFLTLLTGAFFVDVICNLLRWKHLVCSVSAAVTAAMLSLLTVGAPLWGRMIGVAAALLLGKHIWGGMGKNILNPAVFGLLVVERFFTVPYPFFDVTWLLIPALILGIPFLKIRPFAGIGAILGMISVLLLHNSLTLENVLVYGVLFYGCMIMTDPVTVTANRVIGAIIGFAAGFGALFYQGDILMVIMSILLVNMISYLLEDILPISAKHSHPGIRIRKAVCHVNQNTSVIDLTGEDAQVISEAATQELTSEEVLRRILENKVFGMGGGAHSTYQKIDTVMHSEGYAKYLLINGVECDPGLVHDRWILRNRSEQILQGVRMLRKCISFAAVHLAVKEEEGLVFPEDIHIHALPDYYPAGAERVLISEILNQKVEWNEVPAEHGMLVLNVQTVCAIAAAIDRNKAIDTRYLTVANMKNKSAHVVKVRMGMKLHEVLEAVYPGSKGVYAGGGIMQAFMADENTVVDQKVNFIATAQPPAYKESPQCSKCGECIRNCPAGLQVNKIADLIDHYKYDQVKQYQAQRCNGCGICSYSCKAGKNLAERVKRAKEEINNQAGEDL